ncbi:MAG: hypothetical protein MJY74_02845 [Bacteroidaceae bacterium]|nr:hypothetical protein [Bacteroidaceae bacterium]
MKTLLKIFLLVAVVLFCECGKQPENEFVSCYELAFVENDGAVYRSSELFSEDEKMILTDNIYYEQGMYFAQGQKAQEKLCGAFDEINGLWKEYVGTEYCSLYFLYFPSSSKSVSVKTRADANEPNNPADTIVLDSVQVENCISELRQFLDDAGIKDDDAQEYNSVLLSFGKERTLSSFDSLKSVFLAAYTKKILIDTICDIRAPFNMIVVVGEKLKGLNSIIGKYRRIFGA